MCVYEVTGIGFPQADPDELILCLQPSQIKTPLLVEHFLGVVYPCLCHLLQNMLNLSDLLRGKVYTESSEHEKPDPKTWYKILRTLPT
jgi:hypothetical protein